MTLDQALHVLAEIHTKDDDATGFVLLIGAHANDYRTQWTQADHIEAWRVVRQHLHMQTQPSK